MEAFIETLLDYMSENEKVMITGLGTFEMKTVKERKARMPLGGDDIIIPEHRKMKFYPSRLLQSKGNGDTCKSRKVQDK